MRGHPPTVARRRFGMGGPTLAELGERALLERLVAIAAASAPRAAASGDDAAVWTPPAGCDLATSVDAIVEGVDFRRAWIDPHRLGRRAFAVAVSDLAAMGAQPHTCLATLCARGAEEVEDVLGIQRGLCEAAAAAGCALVGGDVSAIEGPMVIDVCVTGTLPSGKSLRRDAGHPGDLLVVTGTLGRAAAGLQLLLDGARPTGAVERGWIDAQLEPVARLREGMSLLDWGVRCAGDVSDGVLVDAGRTAAASGCGAELWTDHLPVDAHLRARFSQSWLELATGGGEDFELLAAVAEADLAALQRRWPGELAPLTLIGTLTNARGVRLLDGRDGSALRPPRSRAEHYA